MGIGIDSGAFFYVIIYLLISGFWNRSHIFIIMDSNKQMSKSTLLLCFLGVAFIASIISLLSISIKLDKAKKEIRELESKIEYKNDRINRLFGIKYFADLVINQNGKLIAYTDSTIKDKVDPFFYLLWQYSNPERDKYYEFLNYYFNSVDNYSTSAKRDNTELEIIDEKTIWEYAQEK